MSQQPTLGRIVLYRSRTGDYDVPAIVTATTDTLNPRGVEAGHIPPLTSDWHVHLTVFTAGQAGLRGGADFKVTSQYPVSENVAGCYQEWDVRYDETRDAVVPPGTWRWPPKV